MLVDVAGRPAVVSEEREEGAVGDDFDGEVAAELEPLGALSPVVEGDGGAHAGGVAAAADGAGVVEGADEAVWGGGEVAVDDGEGVEGDACLAEEQEAVVGEVEEGVGEEASLGVHHC